MRFGPCSTSLSWRLLEGEEILFKREKLFSLRGELELELSLTRAPLKRLTAILVPRFP